jgi:hypothetical protein
MGSSFPPRPIAPLSPPLGVELFAAELLHELLSVFGVCKAVHVPPLVIVEDRMAARAQRQLIAERVNDFVAPIYRYRGG